MTLASRAQPSDGPERDRAEQRSPVRPAAIGAAFLVVAAIAGLAAIGGFSHGHDHAAHDHAFPRPQLVTDDGLEVVLVGFERLRDGHAGVNSPVLPMNSKGMPMSGGMGPIGDAIEKGQERVAVSVLLHNRGKRPHAYSPDSFSLTSDGGAVQLLRRTQSTFAQADLVPGARVSATLYMVMPEGAWPLALSYKGDGSLPLAADRPPVAPAGGVHEHDAARRRP